ncbi:relaxase/mobilization nuclease domain-containing protein, partial [Paeniroseomonas aquatica]
MKSNVKRGGGFAGLLRYALDRGLKCEIVGGNMEGRNPSQLAREFGASRRQRREVKRPVLHATLSLPPGEHLSPEAWNELAHAFMRKIDLDPEKHQFVVIRHDDTHCEHVHIITSRIGLDGHLWHGVNEALVATRATQELERKYGLTITKGPNLETEKAGAGIRAGLKMKRAERELWAQRGVEAPKAKIARAVDLAIRRSDGTPDSLRTILEKDGINTRISIGGSKVTGISYGLKTSWDGGDEETTYKGGHVGARCDAKSIERRLAERREQLARDASMQLRAQEVRFENELDAVDPERMARLTARVAEIRRQNDAETPAPIWDRVAPDPRPAAGDGPSRRQGSGEPADPAGLRDELGGSASRRGESDARPQGSDAPPGPG